MTYSEAISELENFKNERGIKNYKKIFGEDGKYLGLGLTQLRKIAKKIKIDPTLAPKLQKSKYFEARMLSFMVDDPNLYNKQKLENLIKELPEKYNESPLSYFTMVFTEYIVAKSPDVKEVIIKWSKSKNSISRFIAYSTLSSLGKNKKIEDEFFNQFLPVIESNIQNEVNNVKDAMNNSLFYWGQRNKNLNTNIRRAFKKIGKVTVDYGDTSCQTPDVPKFLSSDRIIKKFS